eukprot:TRINITY_DN2857_c0_g1_i1.p1 TRINITY_DN2857_c0_g1~~TRINITY_DN2857_c0_g1_i1.p1  ORF type:complete len:229 (-),score=55.92 TRINITY_DN2857_c0_g1_i1:11-697(-)
MYFQMFVSSGEGTLLTCGIPELIGRLNSTEDSFRVKELGPEKYKKIATGWTHSLALTEEGVVFSWGLGLYGALGQGDNVPKHIPRAIETLESVTIVDICCGVWHSAVVSDIGDVYTFGLNHHGQLGIGSSTSIAGVPRLVEFSEDGGDDVVVKQIACGSRHTVAVTEDGALCGWGFNKKRQLGDSIKHEVVFKPTALLQNTAAKAVQVNCGHWTTAILISSTTKSLSR